MNGQVTLVEEVQEFQDLCKEYVNFSPQPDGTGCEENHANE